MIANKVFNAGAVKEGDEITYTFKGNASPSITEIKVKLGCSCTSINSLPATAKDKEGNYTISVDGDFSLVGTVNTRGGKTGKKKKMITITEPETIKLFIEYEIR